MQGQLRPLDPHVLCLLGQVQCAALFQVGLAPAALLMEELHGKLVEAMTHARRPAFLKAAAVQDQPAGKLLRNLPYIPALHPEIHNLGCASPSCIELMPQDSSSYMLPLMHRLMHHPVVHTKTHACCCCVLVSGSVFFVTVYGMYLYISVHALYIHHCACITVHDLCMYRGVSLCGLCVHAGLQQTPQEIWEGLKSTLPALRGLLTSCSDVLISGMLKLNKTPLPACWVLEVLACSHWACWCIVGLKGSADVSHHGCCLLWLS